MNSGLMELEETLYRLELLIGADLFPSDRVEPLMREAEELTAIFVTLIKKWRKQ